VQGWQKLMQPEIQSDAEIIVSMDSHVKKWHELNAQLPEDKRLPSPFPDPVLIDHRLEFYFLSVR
jgi:hypothetical protein